MEISTQIQHLPSTWQKEKRSFINTDLVQNMLAEFVVGVRLIYEQQSRSGVHNRYIPIPNQSGGFQSSITVDLHIESEVFLGLSTTVLVTTQHEMTGNPVVYFVDRKIHKGKYTFSISQRNDQGKIVELHKKEALFPIDHINKGLLSIRNETVPPIGH